MKTAAKIILRAFLLGAVSWLTEGIADYYTFHGGKGSIWPALVFVSPNELLPLTSLCAKKHKVLLY